MSFAIYEKIENGKIDITSEVSNKKKTNFI